MAMKFSSWSLLAAQVGTLGLVATLAACGGSDDPAPPPPAPAVGSVESVTLLAGGGDQAAGTCGVVDGVGAAARLGNVRAMSVAADGTVYTLENPCGVEAGATRRVRAISPDGKVTTMAVSVPSDYQHTPGQLIPSFRNGRQLAIGDSGAVYLSDAADGVFLRPMYSLGEGSGIWKITPTGAQPFAGIQSSWMGTPPSSGPSPADGQGLDARFDSIESMVFSQGALLVRDFGGHIRRVTEDATVTTVTLPMLPDLVDNAGALYEWSPSFDVTQSRVTRFDGRITETSGLRFPLAVAENGAVYGVPVTGPTAVHRRSVDGADQVIGGAPNGPQPSWVTAPYRAVSGLGLDRAGNLYVAHGHLLWRVTFVK